MTTIHTKLEAEADHGRSLVLGLISDTHGVLCDEVVEKLRGVCAILHAGDVGHHGGTEEVLTRLRSVVPVYAVRGNVDGGCAGPSPTRAVAAGKRGGDAGGAAGVGGASCGDGCMGGAALESPDPQQLPDHRLLEVAGWRLLITHILGQPPDSVDPQAAALIELHRPHMVVFGHSHKHSAAKHGRHWFYNPGSAGQARFKLPRTVALLELPRGGPSGVGQCEAEPVFTLIHLAAKAPPRLTAKVRTSRGSPAKAAVAATAVARVRYPPWLPVIGAAVGAGGASAVAVAQEQEEQQVGGQEEQQEREWERDQEQPQAVSSKAALTRRAGDWADAGGAAALTEAGRKRTRGRKGARVQGGSAVSAGEVRTRPAACTESVAMGGVRDGAATDVMALAAGEGVGAGVGSRGGSGTGGLLTNCVGAKRRRYVL